MRENEDNIRLYAPLLRRIIILVTVIIAVPVVLWTITAFMRTYVAPPKVPTFRPLATATLITTPNSAAADTATVSPAAAPSPAAYASQPNATATDANGPRIPTPGPVLSDRTNNSGIAAPAGRTNVAVVTADAPGAAPPGAADNIVVRSGTEAASTPWPTVAAQPQPASNDTEADALPAGQPLTGPVPLPHPRPRVFAMAETGVPMPRPRPTIAEAATTPATTDGPLDWLGNIFHQSQQ
jgi:hypothetical protein